MAAQMFSTRALPPLLPEIFAAVISLTAADALAQNERTLGLDEIVVTAQRREQSLLEVPISVEVYSGGEIRQQGFRDMDDLANFSPTVLIEPRVQDQDISIRGFGTTGNALTLDQAVPTFVDGIHFGRSSQIKLAFLDVESVEVLKGPQPVYFGQNATAGAFNIRSRRPTDEWEGYVDAEVGSNSTRELTFGVGGPLSERWGLRVAGAHEASDGYLDYVVTGESLGAYENNGARIVLQFEPTDRLRLTGKIEASKIRKDSETIYQCRTDGPLIFGRGGPLDEPGVPPGDERSVWDQTDGAPWSQPFTPLDTDCFSSNHGVSEGGPYFEPPQTIREENSDIGVLDIRGVSDAFVRTAGNNGTGGYEDLDGANGYLEATYFFDNEITLDWLTGWSDYQRDYVQDNSNSPFLTNFQGRGEDFRQWSSELRLTSGAGGRFEWNAGAFFQTTDLTAFASSLRANVRQSQRYNLITEEVDFKAVFGTLTFNFPGDRLALDVGGRFQDVDKFATVRGYGASWVFDVCPEDPCDPLVVPSDLVFDPELGGYTGDQGDIDGSAYYLVDPASARLFLPVDPGTPLYAMPFLETRDIPEAWWSGNAVPVGLTAPDFPVRESEGEGPFAENFAESGFSPQVTLRFHATEDISVYARYAEATKIGGFDTGQTSIPASIDELTFETEDAEQMELGIKGTLWNDRFGFDAALFELEFPNLQTTVLSPDPEQTSASANAGQRVRGVEFNTLFAATDRLRLGFSGAIMDGEMTSFPGAGCTDAEIAEAISNPDAPCKFFDEETGEPIPAPSDPVEAFDSFSIIDRTGEEAPRTPDWKFVLTADYFIPLSETYEMTFNAKGFVSDGYIVDVESFNKIVKYNKHEDLNVLVGLHNVDMGWSISAFARNLLEARPSYNPEFDVFPDGLASAHVSPSSFTTYGIKLEYLFE
jgi:iron complex outermembrane recepter protein